MMHNVTSTALVYYMHYVLNLIYQLTTCYRPLSWLYKLKAALQPQMCDHLSSLSYFCYSAHFSSSHAHIVNIALSICFVVIALPMYG